MATTITFTPRTPTQFYTITEINALFAQIKAVLDNKLDVRGDIIGSDLLCVNTSIINVGTPTNAGDLLRNT